MNMHIAQSYQTMEELAQLASVPTQIITPRESKPIISVVQDIATGLYRLTKSNVRVTEKQLFNLVATNTRFKGTLPAPKASSGGVPYWTGRQVLSQIFPERLNIEIKEDAYDESKTREENKEFITSIKCGELVSGKVSKDVYQARTRGVVHSIYNEYGPDETRQLFDNTQRLICDWLVYSGFSCGVSDLVVPASTDDHFHNIINSMKRDVYAKMKMVHENRFENESTNSTSDYFESQVNKVLNGAINKVGEEGVDKIDEDKNRLINMIKSKSKGNKINVSQMIGCVGQQNVDGRRIPYGFDDRTLPHYAKYDDGPEARGFVENSFVKGLTPQEFFFHAMGGREGLIDTAVNSVTGDTPIIIIENGKPKYTEIGTWIDAHLDNNKDKIKFIPEQANLEMYNLESQVYIPTTDAKGNVTWGEMTAVTRHDPSKRLYKIMTESGRSVIVAESKSLLIWDEATSSFEMKHTPDVKLGDYVPVTANLSNAPVNLHDYDEATFTHEFGIKLGRELIHNLGYVPDYLFNAPKDFIQSVISGFFIKENVCPTEKLANGLSLLFARLGMLSKMDDGHVSIWAQQRQQNDVALDRIINILTIESDERYAKLYDVTVPSTLNFMIANGLQVVDKLCLQQRA